MSLELGGGNRDRFKYDFNYCIYYTEYCNYSDYLNAGGEICRSWRDRGAADTYWGKNKGRSMEGMLVKLTRIFVILFLVIAMVLNLGIW